MATIDKHPPLDPKRHSTNKRVKPLGENIFGTPVLTAEGSKRVRPGDDNTTSAKFLGPGSCWIAARVFSSRPPMQAAMWARCLASSST